MKALQNKLFIVSFIIAALLNIGSWVALYTFLPYSDLPVILTYNIYFGISLIGAWYQLFFLPLSGSICLMLNATLGILLHRKEPILINMLQFATVMIQLILMAATVLIIQINLV